MILLHHPEVELSRTLLGSMPEGVMAVTGDGGYPVSAYPSVVVTVPAYIEKRPTLNAAGEFAGVVEVEVPAHEELLRMPASWEAVQSFVDFAEARAVEAAVEAPAV